MIPLGYEIGTGKRVSIPRGHTIVLGQTQKSGKTTTLEAMTARSGVKAIAFITKRGEKSFRQAHTIPPYYSETSETQPYWKFVISIIESAQDVKLGFREKGWIMELCSASSLTVSGENAAGKRKRDTHSWKEPKTLRDVLANAELALKHSKGISKMICRQLVEYLKIAVPEIEKAKLSSSIELKAGINVMDISKLSMHVQALIIRSVVEWVYLHCKNTVVIIPEAWKFLPEYHTTPVSAPVQELIRQGAVIGNFVWIDLQDLRGIQKMLLRSIQVWLFGVQREKNEVENTLKSMPTPEVKPTAQEMMQLKIGEFLVAYDTELYRCYVQPAGMEDVHAQAIARGDEKPESWGQIVKSLDAKPESAEEGSTHDEKSIGSADDDGAVAKSDQPAAGSPRAAEGDAQRMEQDGDREDAMWKDKYEAAVADAAKFVKEQHLPLVEAHDALAKRVRELETLGDLPSSGSAPFRPGSVPKPSETCGDECTAPSLGNGNLDAVYRYIVDRAAKEQEPALLSLLMDRPELMVKVERRMINSSDDSTQGRIAVLIYEKFFDTAKDAGDVTREFKRRGWFDTKASNAALIKPLAQITEWGFLSREDAGYQAVAGMKVNIVEARA